MAASVRLAEGAQATATAQPQGSTATTGRNTGVPVFRRKDVVTHASEGRTRGQLCLFGDGSVHGSRVMRNSDLLRTSYH